MDPTTDLPPGVAIIGMAGRFPGAASVEELWENLRAGRESIARFTEEEVVADGVPPETARDPAYVRARALIDGPELFDAGFFGISPREAELMDPQHRLFLECCWTALEHAGYAPASMREVVGVWAGMSTGMSNDTYLHSVLGGPGGLRETDVLQGLLGNANDYLTTRVSHKLDLRGPSVNVQTACSTSLVATVQGFQSLLTFGCDVALAGGVSVSYPQRAGYLHQEGGVESPDGHCRPFDERAQGTVFGNGVAVVVLKRVEDAVEDGDTIYAVVRGGAVNNDGSSKVSFAAPSVDGQAEVIAMAQEIAGVDAGSVSYVEAHGTGTPMGDPIEVAALTRAFRRHTDESGFCALGSVKSNFGHLVSAAAVTGLIKTTLCLHHRTLVPTVHFEKPNPRLELESTPFYVNAETRPWTSERRPLRAGVSGFGIGGTNAHVVLEEAPDVPDPPAGRGPELLVLSARTGPALEESARRLAEEVRSASDTRVRDVAYTLQVGREGFVHRAAVVAEGDGGSLDGLERLDPACVVRGEVPGHPVSTVFMFPGGGAQYVGMAAGLYDTEPGVRRSIDRGLDLLLQLEGVDLRRIWFPAPGEEEAARTALERPAMQLPALFILEMALAEWWREGGVEPEALIGHSLGENTAACVAGVFDYEDALRLVTLRGRLFERVPGGGMLSVASSLEDLEPHLRVEVDVAAVNGPYQVTVSGPKQALAELGERLEREGIEARTVPIEIAAHSRMVEPILPEFRAFLGGIRLRPPELPVISNRTGRRLSDAEATDPEYWTGHLRETVRFAAGIRSLGDDEGRIFLEVGPGRILGSLVKLNLPGAVRRVVGTMRHAREDVSDAGVLHEAIGRLWVGGHAIDWPRMRRGRKGRRIPLPTYPFQRRPYLADRTRTAQSQLAVGPDVAAPRVESGEATLEDALSVQRRVTRAILALLGDDGDEDRDR